jgi:hypothetical protein
MILAEENILPYTGSKAQHGLWLAEALWGHRIERQPASALLLEFLSMAEGMHRQEKLLSHPPEHNSYIPHLSTQLRNLLFNNPTLEETFQEIHDEELRWETWLQTMHTHAVTNQEALRNFSYLRDRFESFQSLVEVVQLLRNISLGPNTERRWTYMLLFPIGPAAFYDERSLKAGKDGLERTRVLFTRTGELAYLMLSRSRLEIRSEIAVYLAKALDPAAPKNLLLLRLMSGKRPDTGEEKSGTYLPYLQHPAFDRLGEDVLALFRLNLPGEDTFAHLGPLLAFHLLLYQFETANAVLGVEGLPPLICEILARKPSLVRRASVGSHNDNESLGTNAVERLVASKLDADQELKQALEDTGLEEGDRCEIFKQKLEGIFAFKKTEELKGVTVEELRNDFRRKAKQVYADAGGDAVSSLAQQCGLASKIKTTQYRYAPSDKFLRNLVYVTVRKPIKESDFLRLVYQRYRIVIGPEEAKETVRDELFSAPEFERNTERLLRRLMAMGLAHRMSDSFTYILNPLSQNNGN